MQGKTWKVKYEKADELISRRECFGWNFMSKSTGGPGHKISISMNRDNDNEDIRRTNSKINSISLAMRKMDGCRLR